MAIPTSAGNASRYRVGRFLDICRKRHILKTPPPSPEARVEAGFLLRQLQAGQSLSMPRSRPMPVIGARCHELRIQERNRTWRIIYRIDSDAIIILEVFAKTTQATPKQVIAVSQQRLRLYDEVAKGGT
jgi:phage-related protein